MGLSVTVGFSFIKHLTLSGGRGRADQCPVLYQGPFNTPFPPHTTACLLNWSTKYLVSCKDEFCRWLSQRCSDYYMLRRRAGYVTVTKGIVTVCI